MFIIINQGDPSKGLPPGGDDAADAMKAVTVACGGHHTLVARADRKVIGLEQGVKVINTFSISIYIYSIYPHS